MPGTRMSPPLRAERSACGEGIVRGIRGIARAGFVLALFLGHVALDLGDVSIQQISDAVMDDVADLFDFRQRVKERIGPTALGGHSFPLETAGLVIEPGIDPSLGTGRLLFGELLGLGVMVQEFALVKKSAGSPAE